MKIYQYWHREDFEYHDHNNQLCKLVSYGGSNRSLDDAKTEALKKIESYREQLNSGENPFQEYSVEIREEIIKKIDENNIVTRNHYGALVLNSAETIILDIDRAKTTVVEKLMFWKRKNLKVELMEHIENACQKFSKYGFRIYETRNGYRVIVTDFKAKPSDQLVQKMFEEFYCDKLYHALCNKQECYRARLTPKPEYLRCKRVKIKFPRTPEQNSKVDRWIEYYNRRAHNKAVCRFVKSIGGEETPITRYHDEMTLLGGDLF